MLHKKIVAIFCFFISAFSGFAQTWFPNGTTWHYNYRSWNLDGTKTDTYVKFEAVRDTVVNSKTCKVIYQTRTLPQLTRFRTSYLIYEENEKVFRQNPMTNAFELYYDINAAVGATWQIFRQDLPFASENLTIEVLSKGTTTINGHTLKKLNVSVNYPWGGLPYQDEIIERIGFRSMFTTVMPYMIDPLCRGLRCFEDSFTGAYSFNIAPTCTYEPRQVGTSEEMNTGSVQIFPNPFRDFIRVNASEVKDFKEGKIVISDITGKEVERGAIGNSATFNFATFKAGVYFITIKQGDKILLRKKLLKQ